MPSPPTPRGGRMALAGRRSRCGRGVSEGTSLCRGTIHARFGNEVERKASKSCGSFARRRSSSYLQGRAKWKHPTRLDASGSTRSNPRSRPATVALPGEALHSSKRRHFRRSAGEPRSIARRFGRSTPKSPNPGALCSNNYPKPGSGGVRRPILRFPETDSYRPFTLRALSLLLLCERTHPPLVRRSHMGHEPPPALQKRLRGGFSRQWTSKELLRSSPRRKRSMGHLYF
jgi:hypothetical protein